MRHDSVITFAAVVAAIALNSASADLWTAGHGDFGLAYDAGALDPHVHLHAGATVDGVVIGSDEEYAPGDAIPQLALAAAEARPVGAQWDFLGVAAGESVWIFPQTEDASRPFVGWGAEELDSADWLTDFTITLTGLAGTGVAAGGVFSMYQTDSFGTPTVQMTSSDGISAGDFELLAAGGHAHYNWAFTQPGTYEATFQIEGTHATDGVKSAGAIYTFQVVPEPTSVALLGLGAAALLMHRARRKIDV